MNTHFVGFREYTCLDEITFGQLHWLPLGYNEIETHVLFFFSDIQRNMRVYQESSEQSEDDSIEM